MRNLIILVLVLVSCSTTPLVAEILSHHESSVALDRLFASLHSSPDGAEAAETERQIWLLWSHDADPQAVALLDEATAAMAISQTDLAEQKLIKLVTAYPDFAEGWNRRATLYFNEGRMDDSLADIARVLALEPRHFGALSGEAMILLAQGKKMEALPVVRDALAVNPHIAGLRLVLQKLEKLQPEL